jgi:hypothetical protein
MILMTDTQASGRVSNSAANPLPASENSAAGQLGQIQPKTLISQKFFGIEECLSASWKRFSLPTGKWPRSHVRSGLVLPDRATVGRGERPAEAGQWI